MKQRNWLPLKLFAACLAGLLLGKFCFGTSKEKMELSLFNGKVSKLQSIINIIDNQYVDHINIDSLNELVIPQVLRYLDPHSRYVPAKDINRSEKDVIGQYYGIGIATLTIDDTAAVISIIHGGPAEKTALKLGDRIIEINGESVTGPDADDLVTDKLAGDYGTQAKMSIKRFGADTLITIDVARGTVPVPSVTSAYMVDSATSYIKLESFSDKTYKEFRDSMTALYKAHTYTNIIIDLRDNGGGRLEQARRLACEILQPGDTVYLTMGRDDEIECVSIDTVSSGLFAGMHVACLVDYNTASAAEMLASSIQDNDRGVIVGRRTYGKGLVQTPIMMPDGSQVNITTQRIYTPSGRTVQKNYNEYKSEYARRASNGEMDSASAFKPTDTTKYFTKAHRTVYSKSGVMPDVFVPLHPADKTAGTDIKSPTIMLRYILDRYVKHKGSHEDFMKAMFDDAQATVEDLVSYAQRHSDTAQPMPKDKKEIAEHAPSIIPTLKAYTHYVLGDIGECEKYLNIDDQDIATAATVLNDDTTYNNILNNTSTK